jgi:hypothetical protein
MENCRPTWSLGRLLSHRIKLEVLRKIDPEDGSIELEIEDCEEILVHKLNQVALTTAAICN